MSTGLRICFIVVASFLMIHCGNPKKPMVTADNGSNYIQTPANSYAQGSSTNGVTGNMNAQWGTNSGTAIPPAAPSTGPDLSSGIFGNNNSNSSGGLLGGGLLSGLFSGNNSGGGLFGGLISGLFSGGNNTSNINSASSGCPAGGCPGGCPAGGCPGSTYTNSGSSCTGGCLSGGCPSGCSCGCGGY